MTSRQALRGALGAAVSGSGAGLSAADRLCHACVELLSMDGAAVSFIHSGTSRGTFGSSGDLARQLDELQFTFGQGPCLDAVAQGAPVLVGDVRAPRERRWPAFTDALARQGMRAVFALPISIASSPSGALDLFRSEPGPLAPDALAGGLLAAELAALPLLDLMTAQVDRATADVPPGVEGAGFAAAGGGGAWEQLAALERVEVYQATGMVMAALDLGPAEALVRLRSRAVTTGLRVSELATAIVERRLPSEDDGPSGPPAPNGRTR